MTSAPPFVHPAPDPGPEVAERVLPRVEAAARRRRARRRFVVAVVPLVAVVAVGVAALAATGDDDGAVVTATEPAATTQPPLDRLTIEPDVPWTMPTLSRDGRTLEVFVSRSCGSAASDAHQVVETPDSVIVAVASSTPPPGPGVDCALELHLDRIEVTLQQPLGGRELYDGLDPEPRDDVLRQGELVEVGYVPDGFTAESIDMTSAEEPWQQTFHAPDGADWYFAVGQVPTAIADRWYGDEEGTPTTVAGRPAELITGPMHGTLETIRFELGDLTVSVWGEMQGPPAFTHRDELVRIAEGVRPPPA